MPETADPVAALSAKDIPTRAAGCRDLGSAGLPIHLPQLVALALDDKSPGVRLAAAAGAADVLTRYRLPPRRDELPQDARMALWQQLKRCDPRVNLGIFQVCGALDLPEATARIFGALRDPRTDLRLGACVGLWRHSISAAANGDRALEAAIVGLFDDTRIRADTLAELARLCASLGYTSALEKVRALSESASGTVALVATESLQRLEWPGSLAGIWVDLGLDAGSVDPAAKPGALYALTGTDTLLRVEPKSTRREAIKGAVRRIWLKRPGAAEPDWAIQIGAATLYTADPEEVTELGDRVLAAEAFKDFALIDPLLPVNASAARLRGVVRLRSGDLDGALEYLSAAVDMKKAPSDTWWFLADTLRALGRVDEARPHLEKYISKAGKRSPWLAEARSRLDG